MKWMILEKNPATGPDPKIIESGLGVKSKMEAEGIQVIGCNLAAMSDANENKAQKLWKKLPKQNAYLGVENMGDKGEYEAKWCQDVLSRLLNTTAKKARVCTGLNRL